MRLASFTTADAGAERARGAAGGAAAILLDDSLGINAAARLSRSALAELAREAGAALAAIDDEARGGFAPLMLHRAALAGRYDDVVALAFAAVPDERAVRPGGGGWAAAERYAAVEEPAVPEAEAVRRQAEAVAAFGLGDRLHYSRCIDVPEGAGAGAGGVCGVGLGRRAFKSLADAVRSGARASPSLLCAGAGSPRTSSGCCARRVRLVREEGRDVSG